MRKVMVLNLGHLATATANQELRRMVPITRDAAHERRQALHLMDQPLLQQELQRAVHRGRRRPVTCRAQAVEQVVSTSRLTGLKDQAQHLPAQISQSDAPALAQRLSALEQLFDAG